MRTSCGDASCVQRRSQSNVNNAVPFLHFIAAVTTLRGFDLCELIGCSLRDGFPVQIVKSPRSRAHLSRTRMP